MELVADFIADDDKIRDNVKFAMVRGVRVKFSVTFRNEEVSILQGLLSLANAANDVDPQFGFAIKNRMIGENFRYFAATAITFQRGVAADVNVLKSSVDDLKLVTMKDSSTLAFICRCHEDGIVPFVGQMNRSLFGVENIMDAGSSVQKNLAISALSMNMVRHMGPQINRSIEMTTATKRLRDTGRALIIPGEWKQNVEAMLVIDSDQDIMIYFSCNWDRGYCIWMDQVLEMIYKFQPIIRAPFHFEILGACSEIEFCKKNILVLLRQLHYGNIGFTFEVLGDAFGIPNRYGEPEMCDVSFCLQWAISRNESLADAPCFNNLNVCTFDGVMKFYISVIAAIEMYGLFAVMHVKNKASQRNLIM